jgi:hypothetical protein
VIQRPVGGFSPPPPPVGDGSGGARAIADRDLDLWNYLLSRPIIPISIPSGAASGQLMGKQCMLVGWTLRETTGTANLQVEFLDGGGTGAPVVGEVTVPAPLPGAAGFSDVDVDNTANTAAAANTATLPAAAGATTYITGFELTGLGATAVATITVTVGGILGGSKIYYTLCPAGVTTEMDGLFVEYARPIPASALNTAITVAASSPGAGNTAIAVTAHGFQRTVGTGAAGTGQSATGGPQEPGTLCRGGLYLRVVTGSVVGGVSVRV